MPSSRPEYECKRPSARPIRCQRYARGRYNRRFELTGTHQPSDMDVYVQQPECRQALDKMLDEALLLADELDDLQEVSIPPFQRDDQLNALLAPAHSKRRHLPSTTQATETR